MKKHIISIVTILLVSIILFSIIPEVQAIVSNPEAYINKHANGNGEAIKIGNIIVGVVRAVGISLSVLILTIIGIKYIMGSVEDKAQYKQTMWPYIIGAILIFSGAEITNIIYNAVHK